jgi:hypothetical protein
MLYMNIITWPPEKRDEYVKALSEALGAESPEGFKIIALWMDLHSNRAFELLDVTGPCDAKTEFEVYCSRGNLRNIEQTAVMEFGEFMKLTAEK